MFNLRKTTSRPVEILKAFEVDAVKDAPKIQQITNNLGIDQNGFAYKKVSGHWKSTGRCV